MKAKDFIGEDIPTPITKKNAALQKQAQHMVWKSKTDVSNPSVEMMNIVNKQMRDHVKGIGQDADKLSKAAGIPRDAVKPPKPLTQRSGKFKNPFTAEEHISNDSAVKPSAKFGPNSKKIVGEKRRKRQTGTKTHLDMSKK